MYKESRLTHLMSDKVWLVFIFRAALQFNLFYTIDEDPELFGIEGLKSTHSLDGDEKCKYFPVSIKHDAPH